MENCLPFHFILKIFLFIPFWHLTYSVPKFPFHSISYHALVVDSILFLLLYHFTPTVVARLKIRKRLILKFLLPLQAPFQHFRFGVRFRFQPLSSKCFRFDKKLTAFIASASSFRFHFHIPGSKPPSSRDNHCKASYPRTKQREGCGLNSDHAIRVILKTTPSPSRLYSEWYNRVHGPILSFPLQPLNFFGMPK